MGRVGLFFDFDGTLSSLGARREEARVRPDVAAVLERLSERFVIAVVSSKDCWFLRERLQPFVRGLACINGLEIVAGGYIAHDEALMKAELVRAIEELRDEALATGTVVEVKRSLLGTTAGLSIDWRGAERPEGLDALLERAKHMGLNVLEYPGLWFVDIYPSKRNKGDAVRILRALLGVDKVVYFGDSANDVPAFDEADVGIFVEHEHNKDYFPEGASKRVKFEELGRWLEAHDFV
ncbi:MAG: HAD-IIB family hydrolase [Desulfurococcaceae archaeon]